MNRKALAVVGLLTIGAAAVRPAAAGEIGVNLFGVSYHYDAREYREGDTLKEYNQTNPGAGIQYVLNPSAHGRWFAESGKFRDSKSNAAFYAGLGWKYFPVSAIGVGAALVYLHSETYGVPVAPLPVISARVGAASLNATWIPALDAGESGAIAVYATVHLWRSRQPS